MGHARSHTPTGVRLRRQFVIEPYTPLYVKNGVISTTTRNHANNSEYTHPTLPLPVSMPIHIPAVSAPTGLVLSTTEDLNSFNTNNTTNGTNNTTTDTINTTSSSRKRTREEIMYDINNKYKIKKGGG